MRRPYQLSVRFPADIDGDVYCPGRFGMGRHAIGAPTALTAGLAAGRDDVLRFDHEHQ